MSAELPFGKFYGKCQLFTYKKYSFPLNQQTTQLENRGLYVFISVPKFFILNFKKLNS